jgi:hypothetical protein
MPTMPAALLAVLLLTAIVDPRLAEPMRLLAEVGAPDRSNGRLGPRSRAFPNRWH